MGVPAERAAGGPVPVSVSFANASATQVYLPRRCPAHSRDACCSRVGQSIEIADRMVRIRDAIRIGYVEGQTNDQIIKRIRAHPKDTRTGSSRSTGATPRRWCGLR